MRTAITLTAATAMVLTGSLNIWLGIVLTAAGVIYSILGAQAEIRADEAERQPAVAKRPDPAADAGWLDPHQTWLPRGELSDTEVRRRFDAIIAAEKARETA